MLVAESFSFEVVSDPGDPRLNAMMALYESSFPERERKSDEAIRAMILSPCHQVVAAGCSASVAGFFILYVGHEIALLEYLATDERLRGRNLGSALYRAAKAAARDLPMLVEAESDRELSADRDLRARRIGFYRRLGCRRIEVFNFILPLPGLGEPPQLDILVDGMDGSSIDAGLLARWLTEIYVGVYGCAPDDPRLREMIGLLPPTLELA